MLEVAAPGLLVVKHHRGDGGKFVNVAVLEGDQIKMIDEQASQLPDCPALLTSLLGFDTPELDQADDANVLVELRCRCARTDGAEFSWSCRRTATTWRESIVQPIPYAVEPPFGVLADLVRRADEPSTSEREWQEELEDAVEAIAGLTAVDGATILTDRCDLLAFGAKITRRQGSPLVEQVSVTEPIEGGETAIVVRRRGSAARAICRPRSSSTISAIRRRAGRVAGRTLHRLRLVAVRGTVHAHRVETLAAVSGSASKARSSNESLSDVEE